VDLISTSVQVLLSVYQYLILARILMSWFPDIANLSIGRLLIRVTEPYMAPFRRHIPPLSIGNAYLDIASLVALIAFSFVKAGIGFVLAYLFHLL
jgi:YggT family protein